jgi:hypothetical protein
VRFARVVPALSLPKGLSDTSFDCKLRTLRPAQDRSFDRLGAGFRLDFPPVLALFATSLRRTPSGACEFSGRPVENVPTFAGEHGPGIRQARRDGADQPQPVRRGERWLGIPTRLDRVMQPAIAPGMGPWCDPAVSQ